MAVRDADTVRIGGFTGIDNVRPATALRPGAARELTNIDLDAAGKAQSRGGYALVLAADSAHSLAQASMSMFAVLDGNLSAFDRAMQPKVLRAGMADDAHPVHYAELNGDVYWMNGVAFRRIHGETLTDTAAWPDVLGQPTLAVDPTSGGLLPGTYQVAVTAQDAEGRESGSTQATLIDVPAGGGIRVLALPPAQDAGTLRVYCTNVNDDVLRHYRDVPAGLGPFTIGASGTRRKPLETQFLLPLPAGHLLAVLGARLWTALDNVVIFGEAARFGLCRATSGFTFPKTIDLLQPCGEANTACGLFIASATRTYWLNLTGVVDPAGSSRTVCYPHGVMPGSGRTVPGTLLGLDYAGPVAFWVASNGVCCAGLPTGQVVPLTEGQMVIPTAEGVATLVRERDGLRQIVLALQGQITGTGLAVGDAAVTTVRRNNVVLS